jgi:hypothetical protein
LHSSEIQKKLTNQNKNKISKKMKFVAARRAALWADLSLRGFAVLRLGDFTTLRLCL